MRGNGIAPSREPNTTRSKNGYPLDEPRVAALPSHLQQTVSIVAFSGAPDAADAQIACAEVAARLVAIDLHEVRREKKFLWPERRSKTAESCSCSLRVT